MIRFKFEDRIEAPRFCSVAAAILGAGALTAGASVFGSSKAASAQTSAAQAGIAAQQGMFNTTKNMMQPFITGGADMMGQLKNWITPESSPVMNSLMGLVTPGANQSAMLEQMPGFQFNKTQGLRAVNNQLAARGLGNSGGAVAKGAANFVSGLAQNTWGSAVDKLMGLFTGTGNMMQNMVGSGVSAGNALGAQATTTGAGIAGSSMNIGNAQAGNWMNVGNSLGSFASAIPGAYAMMPKTGYGGSMGPYVHNPAYGNTGGWY